MPRPQESPAHGAAGARTIAGRTLGRGPTLRKLREDVIASVYIFGIIIAVLFISGLVVAPLLEDEPADPNSPDGDASPEDRREAALDALEELQFEHETGKLSDEDYRRLKNRYARAAVEARREEEGEAAADASPPDPGDAAGEKPAAPAGDESAARGREESAGGGAAVHCPECGSEAAADARFCGQCGTELPA